MITSAEVRVFTIFRDGRVACHEVLNSRSAVIHAAYLSSSVVTLFYSDHESDSAIRKISVISDELDRQSKDKKIVGLFETIQLERQLIAMELPGREKVGASVAMLQHNSLGLTANSVLAEEIPLQPDIDDAHIMPAWLIEEVGCDVTPLAMQAGVYAYKYGDKVSSAPTIKSTSETPSRGATYRSPALNTAFVPA